MILSCSRPESLTKRYQHISHSFVRAKILMQTLWEGKCEWDQPLPADIQAKWYDLTRDLQQAVLIEIPMYYFKEESITTGAGNASIVDFLQDF
jgi:hypothetical protein